MFVPVAFGNVTEESFADILPDARGHATTAAGSLPVAAARGAAGFHPEQRLPVPYRQVEPEWRRLYS